MRLLSVALVLCIGCGAGSEKDPSGPGLSADSSTGSSDAGDSAAAPDISDHEGGLSTDSALDATDALDPPGSGEAAVYAHSASVLYRLDVDKLDLAEIGPFVTDTGTAVSDMTDIAIDKDGVMYGMTFDVLYRINYKPGPPKCTRLATLGKQFNGLTFVPAGTVDPKKEILIGVSNDGEWFRVDVVGSAASLIKLGAYGGGHTSSGDVVGIIGDAVYATTKTDGAFGSGDDHVVMVDPKTGAVLKDIGATGIGGFGAGLWGVGYWGGVMYGFSSDGSLYKIDLKTAKATEVPLAKKPPGGFWGAGVTTRASTVIK